MKKSGDETVDKIFREPIVWNQEPIRELIPVFIVESDVRKRFFLLKNLNKKFLFKPVYSSLCDSEFANTTPQNFLKSMD